jgi:homoserine/homoserine lactone efflux protein
MDISVWLTFFAASWAISISPGAGAVAAMTAGLQHGFARGYFLTFGLVLGLWSLLLLVGVGLGALIVASSTAFAVIKWLGVAYLLWLGIAQWRAPAIGLHAQTDGAAKVSRRSILMRGWMINTLNPKPTLFMLAVVPQFLNPTQALLPQYLVMAATLAFTDLVVNAGYTAFAARALAALRTPRQMRWVNRVFGSLFIALATALATVKRGP